MQTLSMERKKKGQIIVNTVLKMKLLDDNVCSQPHPNIHPKEKQSCHLQPNLSPPAQTSVKRENV